MPSNTAIKIVLGVLVVIVIFHLCIVFKIIPYDIAWGGRLKSDTEMYVFESISISLNLFLILLLAIKGGFVMAMLPLKVVNIFLWIFLILFVLNTIGNLLAETNFEKFFAILTLALAVLIGIILRKKT